MLKRRIFFFLFLAASLFAARGASAQKLYLLIGGDYRDPRLGRAIKAGVQEVVSTIETNMPPKYLVRYNAPKSSWRGPEISWSRNAQSDIMTAIERCPAGPDDAIFFYWCGHGAYDVKNGEKKHYLLMPNRGRKSEMYRSKILSALRKKRPRLVVLITDSCNFKKIVEPKPSPACGEAGVACAPAAPWPEPAKTKISPLFLSLFFQCSGTVDVNSSDWDQKALIGERSGSVFSSVFSMRLVWGDEEESWNDFLQGVNERLNQPVTVAGNLDHDHDVEWNNQSLCIWTLPQSTVSPENPEQDTTSATSDAGENPTGDPPAGDGPDEVIGYLSADASDWSAPRYHPERGDRIVEVNGAAVQNLDEFSEAIRNSDNDVILTLADKRSGNQYYMKTTLLPKGSGSRLGIFVRNDGGDGVAVTNVMANMPGNRCSYLRDGNVKPVKNRGNIVSPVF